MDWKKIRDIERKLSKNIFTFSNSFKLKTFKSCKLTFMQINFFMNFMCTTQIGDREIAPRKISPGRLPPNKFQGAVFLVTVQIGR